MTSIAGVLAPAAGVEQEVPAWLKFDWSPEIQQKIYKDWGTYYFNRCRRNTALHYYNKALELDEDDYQTLYRRSQTLRKAAKIEDALSDAIAASEMATQMVGPSCLIDLQVGDALFELNKFEYAKLELHNCGRKFIGVKAKHFDKRLTVVDDVIKDCTGKALSSFYLKNQKVVKHVKELLNAKEAIDTRPSWKILSEQKKCDVLSIPEFEELELSPLEVARRGRGFNLLHQNYINNSWFDVLFMKNLRHNPNLLLEQCKRSNDFLQTLSQKQYEIVRQFMKMLQSRSPMYYASSLKFPNVKMYEKNKEAYLFRVQYQTNRNMIADLRHIRKLRKEKNIKSLSKYVEKIMGDYYVTKTTRVMCWKFQFINEVYNTLALALAEQYLVPKKIVYSFDFMTALLALPKDKFKEVPTFVFGDRSTYQKGEIIDPVALRARKLISRFEKRIRFSNYTIEKCYLYHQIADIHLRQGRYDECCFIARKAIQECKKCNSLIWKFLSIMLLIKSNTLQHKLEGTGDALQMALPIANQLNCPQLTKFIETCMGCNGDEYIKKMSQRASQRSSKSSIFSSYSKLSSPQD